MTGFPWATGYSLAYAAKVETFRVAPKKAKRQCILKRAILVVDWGMVSEEVLKEIEQAGLEYIARA